MDYVSLTVKSTDIVDEVNFVKDEASSNLFVMPFNRLHHGMFLAELQKSAGLHRHSSSNEYNSSWYVAFGVRFRRPDHHNAQWNRWGMSICYVPNWEAKYVYVI